LSHLKNALTASHVWRQGHVKAEGRGLRAWQHVPCPLEVWTNPQNGPGSRLRSRESVLICFLTSALVYLSMCHQGISRNDFYTYPPSCCSNKFPFAYNKSKICLVSAIISTS